MGGKAKKEARLLKLAKKELTKNDYVAYTQAERSRKITSIMFELGELKLDHVIPPNVTKSLVEYVNTGCDYDESIYLPEYSRTLVIHLDNNKKNDGQNSLCLKFNKVTVDEKNEVDNPINKLVELQQDML
jgi:hypothetical protein